MKTAKRLKAYQVSDGDDGCCIQFATNGATARREGANELNTEWEGIDYCRRAPEFDAYAPGPVPLDVMIKNGWWFECQHCGRRVDEDLTQTAEDDGLDPDNFQVVMQGRSVFCSHTCAAEDYASKRARSAAYAAFVEVVESKFTGCTITYLHIYGDKLEASPAKQHGGAYCSAHFTFPGGKYQARWDFGDEKSWVNQEDVKAFQSLYSPSKELQATSCPNPNAIR